MRRIPKAMRLEQIADAALASFSENGFRLTQVADIARRAEVSPGTIYLFADSKEQLFWLAFCRAMGQPLEGVACATPPTSEIRSRFAPDGASPSLARFLRGKADSLPRFETVLSEYWSTIADARIAIQLVEKCARDWPEPAEAFYEELRPAALSDLREYLERGAKAGVCRPVPDVALAARFIVESISWFAMHRHGDMDGRHIDAATARSAALDALEHAYGPAPGQELA